MSNIKHIIAGFAVAFAVLGLAFGMATAHNTEATDTRGYITQHKYDSNNGFYAPTVWFSPDDVPDTGYVLAPLTDIEDHAMSVEDGGAYLPVGNPQHIAGTPTASRLLAQTAGAFEILDEDDFRRWLRPDTMVCRVGNTREYELATPAEVEAGGDVCPAQNGQRLFPNHSVWDAD